MNRRERGSKLRLEIRKRQDHLSAILNSLQGGGPMIRGSIYMRRRRCGKLRCRCMRDQPHQDRVLAVRRAGRVVLRSLDVRDASVEKAVAAWRGFRRQRGELTAACRNLLRTVDRLASLRVTRSGGVR